MSFLVLNPDIPLTAKLDSALDWWERINCIRNQFLTLICVQWSALIHQSLLVFRFFHLTHLLPKLFSNPLFSFLPKRTHTLKARFLSHWSVFFFFRRWIASWLVSALYTYPTFFSFFIQKWFHFFLFRHILCPTKFVRLAKKNMHRSKHVHKLLTIMEHLHSFQVWSNDLSCVLFALKDEITITSDLHVWRFLSVL